MSEAGCYKHHKIYLLVTRISVKSLVLMVYALTGFSNLVSLCWALAGKAFITQVQKIMTNVLKILVVLAVFVTKELSKHINP